MGILDQIAQVTGGAAMKAIKDNIIVPDVQKKIDTDSTYAGLTNAETSAFKDPYIRTTAKKTPGGSTAFGPAQITYTLAREAADKGWLSKDSQVFFKNIMEPKYKMMLQNGNNKDKVKDYNSAYDYGGTAEFDPGQHNIDYEMFAKDIIDGLAKRAGQNKDTFLKLWRGKSMSEDPAYFDRYNKGSKNFLTEHGVNQ